MPETRNYAAIRKRLAALALEGASREEKMRVTVDLLWEELSPAGVAWLGFYVVDEGREGMVLAYCRPKPACSPIGLHGVCGRAFLEKKAQVVPDVHALGAAHIVCDPANLSEVVVPCVEADGLCWGVLDLDSREREAFSSADARGLTRILTAAGLTG